MRADTEGFPGLRIEALRKRRRPRLRGAPLGSPSAPAAAWSRARAFAAEICPRQSSWTTPDPVLTSSSSSDRPRDPLAATA